VAMQLHARAEGSVFEADVGLVLISRLRIAESRAKRAEDEGPDIGVPPVMEILAAGWERLEGDELRVVGAERGFGRRASEMRFPEAEGGVVGLRFLVDC
jgi:hypothetical protein